MTNTTPHVPLPTATPDGLCPRCGQRIAGFSLSFGSTRVHLTPVGYCACADITWTRTDLGWTARRQEADRE